MRLIVAAIGRLKAGPERELAERFRDRVAKAGRAVGLRDIEIVEIRESKAADVARRVLEESIALANIIPERAVVVALDETGENLDSGSFTGRVAQLARCRAPGRGVLHRRRRRPRRGRQAARRSQARVRRRHLAAPAGAHHAAGAALPGGHDPGGAPVSPGLTVHDMRIARLLRRSVGAACLGFHQDVTETRRESAPIEPLINPRHYAVLGLNPNHTR